jgi:hypothetical protein
VLKTRAILLDLHLLIRDRASQVRKGPLELDVVLANILGPLLEGIPGIPLLLLQILEAIVVLQGIPEELPRVSGLGTAKATSNATSKATSKATAIAIAIAIASVVVAAAGAGASAKTGALFGTARRTTRGTARGTTKTTTTSIAATTRRADNGRTHMRRGHCLQRRPNDLSKTRSTRQGSDRNGVKRNILPVGFSNLNFSF